MALDPRIPLQAQYQPIDTLGVLMHRRQMQRQEALDAEARNDRDEARKDRDLDRKERAEDRTLRREQLNRQVKRDATEDEMRDLDIAIRKADVMGRVLGTVKDQASYNRARATLGRFGIQTDQFDPVYKPDVIAGYVAETDALRGKLGEAKTHWVVRTNPDGSQTAVAVEDKPGVTADLGKKADTPTNRAMQSKRISWQGKPVSVPFNPDTGEYELPDGTKRKFVEDYVPPRSSSGGATGVSSAQRAVAERWKASQLRAFEQRVDNGEFGGPGAYDEAAIHDEKLNIENAYRAQLGLQPLEELPSSWNKKSAGKAAGTGKPAAGGAPVYVNLPDGTGRRMKFPDQKSADAFKKAAGIQ